MKRPTWVDNLSKVNRNHYIVEFTNPTNGEDYYYYSNIDHTIARFNQLEHAKVLASLLNYGRVEEVDSRELLLNLGYSEEMIDNELLKESN